MEKLPVLSWGEALLNHSPRQTARENQAYYANETPLQHN